MFSNSLDEIHRAEIAGQDHDVPNEIVDPAAFVSGIRIAQIHELFAESRSLPHEAGNHLQVVLAQHRGHGIPFGGKLEQREIVVRFVGDVLGRTHIDIGDLVDVRVSLNLEIGESEAVVVVQLALCIGIHRVAVEHRLANIDSLGGKGDVIAVGAGAHGEEVTSAGHKVADTLGHGQFHL